MLQSLMKTLYLDSKSIVAHFTRSIFMKELRLYGGQEILYEKVKIFMTHHLFNQTVKKLDGLIKDLYKKQTSYRINHNI